MKILFITDNFPPEVNAPATRTFEHCKEWVKNGCEVTVVTCAPNFPQGVIYEGYENKLRYPNTAELRYMIFSSVALGASGIALYSYGRAHQGNPKWGGKVLAPVLKEVKKFTKQVGNLHKREVFSMKDQNILFTLWSNDNANFIILANTTSKNRGINIEIDTNISNIQKYSPWGQTRKSVNISSSGNQLSVDKMMPWEIIILQKKNN